MLQKIKELHLTARRNKNKLELSLWATVLGDVERISSLREISKDEVEKIVRKTLAGNQEVLSNLAESDSRFEVLQKECELLENLLPKQLTYEQICDRIQQMQLPENKGQAIKVAISNFQGESVDNKLVVKALNERSK